LPFTLLFHAGKYKTENQLKIQTTQTEHNPEKTNNAKHSKTKLPYHFYDTQPGKEVDLLDNAP